MSRLTGVKLEKDTKGKIKKVTLDMKYHAAFIEDYLQRLQIADAKKNAKFVEWDIVKKELDKKHGIATEKVSGTARAQGRKTA